MVHLSPREKQLHGMLLSKRSNLKTIANEMGVTLGTAKQYAFRVYGKSGVTCRIELQGMEIERLNALLDNLTPDW